MGQKDDHGDQGADGRFLIAGTTVRRSGQGPRSGLIGCCASWAKVGRRCPQPWACCAAAGCSVAECPP